MYKNKRIAVVVPAYNEEKYIEAAITNVPDYVDRIYAVNDGSTDRTASILSILATANKKLNVITKNNGGVGSAIITGYKQSLLDRMDIMVIMAGDNQMVADCLPQLLGPIAKGDADYTKAERMAKEHIAGMSTFRKIGNFILRWLTRIAAGNFGIKDPQAGYTAISREALGKVKLDAVYPYYGYCNDLLVRLSVAKARILEIPIPYISKSGSKSSKIRYSRYIPRVSWLLLRLFFLRITGRLRFSA
jgi:glycosyltransferase involved in cell wall biosynthesis